jgi:hypothetical protein
VNLKHLIQLSGASIVATSAMTVFSYSLSRLCRQDYREPELLAQILEKEGSARAKKKNKQLGWLAHYTMGILWSSVYEVQQFKGSTKAVKTALLGTGSGLVAAVIWRLMIGRHPRMLRKTKPSFYAQLVPAHIVYALVLEICETALRNPAGKR